jgi:hypothetical protein
MSEKGVTVSEMNLDNSEVTFDGIPFPLRYFCALLPPPPCTYDFFSSAERSVLQIARRVGACTRSRVGNACVERDAQHQFVQLPHRLGGRRARRSQRGAGARDDSRLHRRVSGQLADRGGRHCRLRRRRWRRQSLSQVDYIQEVGCVVSCVYRLLCVVLTCSSSSPSNSSTVHIGHPLPDAVWRSNHGVNPVVMKTQEPLFNNTVFRYNLMHQLFVEYAANNQQIDDVEAVSIVATLGIKGENYFTCAQPLRGDNVLSIAYAPSTLRYYVGFEAGNGNAWRPAACAPFLAFDLNRWL